MFVKIHAYRKGMGVRGEWGLMSLDLLPLKKKVGEEAHRRKGNLDREVSITQK